MKMLEYIIKKFDFYNFIKAHSAGMEIQARFKKQFCVTFMTLPNFYFQIVTFLLLPICHYQIVTFVSLPNCHNQIVITKLSLTNCHYQKSAHHIYICIKRSAL